MMTAIALPAHVPLVVATRGERAESVHYGSIAVVTAGGETVAGVGDGDFPMFTRSTLKPFQAVPFVSGGGPALFGFGPVETALLCASHSGEPRHVAAVAAMLERIGCNPGHLQCGCHPPLGLAGSAPPPDMEVTPLHHNCSGKHAGFLAWCRQHGAPLENYLDPGHPLQRAIRRQLAQLLACREEEMPAGIDGCSAPNYALPLSRLAYAYARLTAAGEGEPLAALYRAMTGHPEMVSGTGRWDLLLMQSAPGDWVAKGGAEGMQALGVRSRGIGIAVKIADGSLPALKVAVAAVLEQLGFPPLPWREEEIRNCAGRLTGHLRPVFRLG